MKRRMFLPLAGLGITAIALPTWYYQSRVPSYDPLISEPELLSYIWDSETIREIGEQYLKNAPKERSKRKLVSELSNNISEDLPTIETLRQSITKDYKDGNTIMLDGWILSKTEARQCALFSLTQNL
ncbi:MAG: hypothetical protein Sapg2KO_41430 [Saprospiraceae bacterium]